MKKVMIPELKEIDHIHINVACRDESEIWYREVMGFARVKELEFWAPGGGPLTLQSSEGKIHLALFESSACQKTTIALSTTAIGLKQWVRHLAVHDIAVRAVDHEVSWSVYFSDPDGNPFEITTYEYQEFQSKA